MSGKPARMIFKGLNGETIEVFDDFAIIDRRGLSRLRKKKATVFFAAVKDLQFQQAGLIRPGYLRLASAVGEPAQGISAAGGDERAILFTREQEAEFRRLAIALLFRIRNGRLPPRAWAQLL